MTFHYLKVFQLYIIAKCKINNSGRIEAVIQRCSVRKVPLKILRNLVENPSIRVSLYTKLQVKERSGDYCEILKNTFFYRTPPVIVFGKIRTKSLKSAKFQFQPFLITLDIIGPIYFTTKQNTVKRNVHRKIFVVVSIHVVIQTSKHLNKKKSTVCSDIPQP